jgi:acyl homoserine lactone synthase
MLTTAHGTRSELETAAEAELATYRHHVFVETLGWKLPCEPGFERDQFDREDTVYIIARDAMELICGCARLLPTTSPYLLAEVFPRLLNGMPAPSDSHTWELSRFSTQSTRSNEALDRDEARRRFCLLFSAVVEAALAKGATRLITFTALGVERILRSIGMHAHRVGPPQLVDGSPVLALWIELDDQTRLSLGLASKDEHAMAH